LCRSLAGAQFQAIRHFDAAAALELINASKLLTLVVCGEEDKFLLLQNSINLHGSLSGQSTLINYPEKAHLLLIEESENFASAKTSTIA
jgi:pimeloyl-ACP methyl ester carboxylesterase